jgi:peptide-methionine (S)-S-oxide reductase
MEKVGFGGSCHWCTEAIFRSLKGVGMVEQGWIASDGENKTPSKAVIVHFDPDEISLKTLTSIHLNTHSCTATHSMRGKYRSAVYIFNETQQEPAVTAIQELQAIFDKLIITKVLPFGSFRLNQESYLDYYYKSPSKPFCKNIVNPKLRTLLIQFRNQIDPAKEAHLQSL